MSDQRAKDTEVLINLGIALDEGINTIEVNDAVEANNDKIDTVIHLSENLKKCELRESIACECGGSYVPRNKTRHMKTVKHLNYFAKNPVTIEI